MQKKPLFRTPVSQISFPFSLKYEQQFLSIGSCFSEHIGKKLEQSGFDIKLNPFGTLFNPKTLFKLLKNTNTKAYVEGYLQRDKGTWCHYDFHSCLRATNQTELAKKIDALQEEMSLYTRNCDVFLVTLGTAWVYRHKELGKVVSNCHKQPNYLFERYLMSVEEVTSCFEDFRVSAKQDAIFIFTVSPVRHEKDNFINNSLSKSTLI